MKIDFQRHNDLTFSSKSEAAKWITEKIPSNDRKFFKVLTLLPNEKSDTKSWGIFNTSKNQQGIETSEKICDIDKIKYINSGNSTNSTEKHSLCELEEFLKPRIDAAIRGEVTDKSVDEIYAAVKIRKFKK